MKFHQLRSLIAVAEKGSIHEASRLLNLTQPAVSKALADLEAEIGAPLFVRSPRGARLTQYGQSLLRHARIIEQELRHAQEDVTTLLGTAKGSLTIGVTAITSIGPFADALKTFVKTNLHVIVNILELRSAQIHDGLADGSIDFGLVSVIGRPSDQRFHWEPLFKMNMAIVARKQHPLRDVDSLEELLQTPWLSLDPLGDTNSLIGATFSYHDLMPPKNILRCTSTVLFNEMATTTNYICLLPEIALQNPVFKGRLEKLQLKQSLPHMTNGLIARDASSSVIASSFIKLIRNCSKVFVQ